MTMYPAAFDYYRARSIREAGTLLQQHPGAKLLAGGHSLIPLMKLRLAAPPAVIDIGEIAELKGISVSGGTIRIGALTTHTELATSPELRGACPLLAEAAGVVGDPAVRNRGTIGGNIAHADPGSDLPPVLLALGARFQVTGPGGDRTVDAASFFTGTMETALGADEVLTAIEIPAGAGGRASAYAKFQHPASRYAVIGVAAALTLDGGRCRSAAVALGGLAPRPLRAAAVERALAGASLSDDAIAGAAGRVADDLGADLLGDLYASAEYRRAVAPVWVKRALSTAASRAA
jgi:carbon-monoxide dehydrogenase medium subunit